MANWFVENEDGCGKLFGWWRVEGPELCDSADGPRFIGTMGDIVLSTGSWAIGGEALLGDTNGRIGTGSSSTTALSALGSSPALRAFNILAH